MCLTLSNFYGPIFISASSCSWSRRFGGRLAGLAEGWRTSLSFTCTIAALLSNGKNFALLARGDFVMGNHKSFITKEKVSAAAGSVYGVADVIWFHRLLVLSHLHPSASNRQLLIQIPDTWYKVVALCTCTPVPTTAYKLIRKVRYGDWGGIAELQIPSLLHIFVSQEMKLFMIINKVQNLSREKKKWGLKILIVIVLVPSKLIQILSANIHDLCLYHHYHHIDFNH